MTTILLLGTGYLVAVALILALCSAARRGDEDMERQYEATRRPVETLPSQAALGRVATELCAVLGAERVSVIIRVPDDPATWVVGACLGAHGVVGRRVAVEANPATGVLTAMEAALLGVADEHEPEDRWRFAHVPIAGTEAVLGAVTVASRRPRAFTAQDVDRIETVARRGARQFDRRRHPRVPEVTR